MTSLAEFIQQKREKAGYSVYGLAEKASISIEVLEDIESGQELFLPVTIRQKLARVLKCSPEEIKKYEREYQFEVVPFETIEELKSKILKRETNLRCPLCGEPLITRIAKMQDLEDNLIYQPKAHCVKCVFQIKE
ncbi:helix-turn-helix transcriptional regulator [bacterium]|nr:helix-turn-helix transcriptional regulator [bacterium]